jgi:hypothetical protein
MKKITPGFLLVLLLLLSAPQETSAQTTLFGGVGRGPGADRGEVITIDQFDAAGTHVGPGASDPQAGITGLAFDSAGRLYASTINAFVFGGEPVSTLIRLDPLTGEQVALIGTIRLADGTPVVINDLAVQPGTDVLYGTALRLDNVTNDIYTIDKATAVATLVGNTGVTGATLAFGPDGTLYMTSAEFTAEGVFIRGFLNTLDPATAQVLTTSAPFTEAHVGGLAVRPTDGVIFASGGFPSDIYTLSEGGELTLLGLTGFGGVGDIAFTPLPTSKGQCKNGGWRTNFAFAFKNQGDCIQFFNTGK